VRAVTPVGSETICIWFVVPRVTVAQPASAKAPTQTRKMERMKLNAFAINNDATLRALLPIVNRGPLAFAKEKRPPEGGL
jgi:hypothetical protein